MGSVDGWQFQIAQREVGVDPYAPEDLCWSYFEANLLQRDLSEEWCSQWRQQVSDLCRDLS